MAVVVAVAVAVAEVTAKGRQAIDRQVVIVVVAEVAATDRQMTVVVIVAATGRQITVIVTVTKVAAGKHNQSSKHTIMIRTHKRNVDST